MYRKSISEELKLESVKQECAELTVVLKTGGRSIKLLLTIQGAQTTEN